ncbi:MAG TPA: hypothetical protein VFG12_10800, partial [Rhodopila sp.]|nr:hypothetical protein [Rhodopila sp.]
NLPVVDVLDDEFQLPLVPVFETGHTQVGIVTHDGEVKLRVCGKPICCTFGLALEAKAIDLPFR